MVIIYYEVRKLVNMPYRDNRETSLSPPESLERVVQVRQQVSTKVLVVGHSRGVRELLHVTSTIRQ
jgi:hypothetical protein